MKKTFSLLAVLLIIVSVKSQNTPNPYASIGKKAPNVVTITNGNYDEFLLKEPLVMINGDAVDRKTGEMVYSRETNPEMIAKLEKEQKDKFRFLSIDPLTNKYPMLTPYQFASNTPIWATDLDGLEALISNGVKTTIVANVIFVSAGDKGVNSTAIKNEIASRITSKIAGVNDEIHKNLDQTNFDIKLNYITTGKDGKPLDINSAIDLAKNNSPGIEYTDDKGNSQIIHDLKTSVVISTDVTGRLESESKYAEFIPHNESNNNTGVNLIEIRPENSFNPLDETGAQTVHELGHFLGRQQFGDNQKNAPYTDHPGGFQNSKSGITSRDPKNIHLTRDDVAPLKRGAFDNGVSRSGEYKEK